MNEQMKQMANFLMDKIDAISPTVWTAAQQKVEAAVTITAIWFWVGLVASVLSAIMFIVFLVKDEVELVSIPFVTWIVSTAIVLVSASRWWSLTHAPLYETIKYVVQLIPMSS